MKKLFLIFLIFNTLKSQKIYSQQDAQYTMYMYNMSIINPAYATSDFNHLNTGLTHRQQWMGIEGAPKTTSFFTHYAIDNKNEFGVSFFNDNVGSGILSETKFSIDYAYIVNIDDYSKLSFGIKAGGNYLKINFDDFQLESGDQFSDELFSENISKFYPNVGTGIFYYQKDRYISFSIPNLLKSKYLKKDSNFYTSSSEENHFYLTAGYVYENRRNDYKLKPSFLVKSTLNGKMAVDLSLNALFNDKIELGASYRVNSSINGLVNFNLNDNLRIGYSYDYSINNLSKFNNGSHEIILLYDFNLFNTNEKSPRFF